MEEKQGCSCEKIYVWMCKLFLLGVVLLAIGMTIMFTPTNPIFKAAYEGRLNDIKNYLSEGGGINALDKYNNTALHWAAKGNQYEVVKYLVQNGIDCSLRNGQGDTALHWSVMSNNATLIEYLVSQRLDINAVNNEGETALHMAIIMNAFKSAQALLEEQANPNIVAKNGNTALHYITPGCAEDETCRKMIDHFREAGCDFTIENAEKQSVFQVLFGKDMNATSLFTNEEL